MIEAPIDIVDPPKLATASQVAPAEVPIATVVPPMEPVSPPELDDPPSGAAKPPMIEDKVCDPPNHE